MRPLEITFAGLRSYIGRHTIDLRDRTLIGITGPTGAGKSTIFEAIFFALYGTCTWPTSTPGVLIADGGDGTMSVELIFTARGADWKVTRSMSRGSAPAVHRLEALDGSGGWGGKRDVDRRIHELIGLDKDTFIRSVLLPQGKFDQLLHTAPGARAGMLKSLLGLDQLDTIHDRARDHRDRLLPAFNDLVRRRAALLDDPRETAAAADQAHTTAKLHLAELQQAESELDRLSRERMELEGQIGRLRDHTERLGEQVGQDVATRLHTLAELEAHLAAMQRAADTEAAPLRERLMGVEPARRC